MLDWDDLRFLLAAARSGSMAAAGRRLGVDQTTVARRVAAAEQALGTRVFRRDGRRLLVAASGRSLLERVAAIERQVGVLRQMADETQNRLSGRVRVAAPITFATHFLAPRLPEFRRMYPDIRLELICDVNVSTMTHAEAEVGLRVSHPLADHLDIRVVSDFAFGLYANPGAMRANAIPFDPTDLRRNPFIAYSEDLAELPEGRWITEIFGDAEPVLRVNTTLGLAAAVEAGIGVAPLPCYLGDRSPNLRRVPGTAVLRSERLWLVTLRELRQMARVRAVVDFIARQIRRDRPLLSGRLQDPESLMAADHGAAAGR